MELINILIRTSNRPALFRRCLNSIVRQQYPNIRIIVSYDNLGVNYIPSALQSIFVTADNTLPFFYDLYCNDLKSLVTDGYFMFLDDDDYLMPNILNELVLDAPACLFQYNRNGTLYPADEYTIRRGQVGMPCLLLHHSLKHAADIPGTGQGDFFWIDAIRNLVGLKFSPKIICGGDQRGHGHCS